MWTTDLFFRFRSWLKLEGPPEIVLSGYDIRRFLSPSMLSLKLADAFVRLLRSLENETMAKRTKSPGRHYVSPQWGVSSFFCTTSVQILFNALSFYTMSSRDEHDTHD